MHGHPVEPLPKDPDSDPFKQGDTEGSLDHLREMDLRKRREESATSLEEAEEEAGSDVDESELEKLILAAHIEEGDAEENGDGETLEARLEDSEPQVSGTDTGTPDVKDRGSERETEVLEGSHLEGPPAEQESEYTVEQYYEWLQWQASQQGAADTGETYPPATTIVHHHHYYYPVAAPADPSHEPVPTASHDLEGAVTTSPNSLHTASMPAVPGTISTAPVLAASPQNHLAWPTPQVLQPLPLGQPLAPAGRIPKPSSTAFGVQQGGQESVPLQPPSTSFEPTPDPHGGYRSEKLTAIAAAPEYEKRLEELRLKELRLKEYLRGTRGVNYRPTTVEEWGFPPELYQCLTAMEVFRDKSLEELRWADYVFDQRFPGWAGEDGGTSPQGGVQGFLFPSTGEGEPSVCEGRNDETQKDGAVRRGLVSGDGAEPKDSRTEEKSSAEQPAGPSGWRGAAIGEGNSCLPVCVLSDALTL